jgi:hypothetical protein
MNSYQESKHSMEVALHDFLDQNATITSSLPNFGTLFSSFSENMIKIQVIRELQEADKSGITQIKEQLKSDLIGKALDISRKIQAYAKMTDKTVLGSEVTYKESDLKKVGGNLLIDRALLLYDKALANLPELGAYGITSDSLATYKTTIDQFSAALPKPRLGITEKKQATRQLALLFEANDLVLDKFDALVEIVRLNQPLFYAAYWNNRKVIAKGNGSLALTATITDANTREGIRGVTVSFTPQNGSLKLTSAKTELTLVKTTREKGIFKVKSLKPGTYNAIMTKPGYKEKVMEVSVAHGEMTNLVAELEKN